jgi:pimeloyl-ACP methyl ester carboxylesterase
MLVDLIHVTTRDGVRLDGIHQPPSTPNSGPLDAVVCVHGTGSNFYASTLFDVVAADLLERNVSVVRVNTRGHDLMSTAATARGVRRLGAAYEILDDCRHDLAAWVGWAKEHCGPRVGLIGHSSGAVKCLYAQAHETDAAVTHLVAVSPPRLSHAHFAAGENSREFLETYHRAKALVEAGEPDALLDVRLPLPFVITAAGYVEKYGPDERYNFLNFLDRVRCKTLLTLGEIELSHHPAFRGTAEAVAQAAPNVDVAVVAGADHFYTGAREALLQRLREWLR